MRAARSTLLFALFPLFTACSLMSTGPTQPSNAGLTRLQGELIPADGHLYLQPCGEPRRYLIIDQGNTSLVQEAATLASKPGKLYADVRGSFVASQKGDTEGRASLKQVYRLQRSNSACADPDFGRTALVAFGHGPDWVIKVAGTGMVIERTGQPALALPFVEERLPDGRLDLSTEANDQRIELWLAPQRCVDEAAGTVSAFTAEFRFNGQPQRGCGWFGGARSD